jgi:hypothetical protein
VLGDDRVGEGLRLVLLADVDAVGDALDARVQVCGDDRRALRGEERRRAADAGAGARNDQTFPASRAVMRGRCDHARQAEGDQDDRAVDRVDPEGRRVRTPVRRSPCRGARRR